MALTPTSPLTFFAAQLRVDGISISFADRRVLTDVSFTLSAGDRTGLIGENGSGKSTLLKIIAGHIAADAGVVRSVQPGGQAPRVGLLHQEPPFAPTSLIAEALESAVAPARAAATAVDTTAHALADQATDRAAQNYADALDLAERVGAWDIESRIKAMLAGLGLGHIALDRETRSLSGGQKSRLALAWLLLSAPDVLLLDEPTNHLDDAATGYLGKVLSSWAGPVLIASHDRAFLDETVTSLVDLDPSPIPHSVAGPLLGDGMGAGIGVTRFSGTYTAYLNARLDALERWEQQYRNEQDEIRRLQAAVRENQSVGHQDWSPRSESKITKKFYADRNATVVSRRVNDSRSRLKNLQERQIRKPPRGLQFQGMIPQDSKKHDSMKADFLTSGGQPRPAFSVSGAAVDGRLGATSLTIGAGEKWLLTGPNGSGKSTLLHLLAGDLSPTQGSIGSSSGLRVGFLVQDVDLPDPLQRGSERTARQAYEDLVGVAQARLVPLATFGLIAGQEENRPVRVLSTGQQRRLALAVILAAPPEVLLLDEPSNHLSLLLVAQLEAAIPNYPGIVVVASHDRWLRKTWTGHRLVLGGD